jgi:hypothetical protein
MWHAQQKRRKTMRQRPTLWITLLAAFAFAAGCASKPDDASLVTNIQSQMFSDPQLKDSNVQVASKQGEVTLTGTVPSETAHLDAYKIASQTTGVTKVNDQIAVQEAKAAPVAEPTPRISKHERAAATPHRSHARRPAPVSNDVQSAYSAPSPAPEPAPVQSTPAAQPVAAAAPAPPPPPEPRHVEIPAGSTMTVRMIDPVDSSVNHPGEIFHASLDAPLVVGEEVVVKKGADVYVRLVSASSAGKFAGKSELHLELVKLEFRGQSYPLVSSTYSMAGGSRGKNTAEKVGGGAALGAIIGAIAGGGKGAAIGAGVGAAGGGVYQGATHGQQVRIPSETKLDFQLDQPVTITVMPRSASASQ